MKLLIALVAIATLAVQFTPAQAGETVLRAKHDTAKNSVGNIR